MYAAGRGGATVLRCGVLAAKIAPVELLDAGVVKRVRGTAFANRVSPAYVSRMVDAVCAPLNRFTLDVYVHMDHGNASDGGVGFGVHLVAETTEGCLLGADWAGVDKDATPGAVATHAVNMLLDQVAQGGCVDAQNACMALLTCALSDSDVSRVRLGRLSDAAVVFLRDIKTFFGVVFKVCVDEVKVRPLGGGGDDNSNGGDAEEGVGESEESDGKEESDGEDRGEGGRREPVLRGIIMSCVGVGLVNTARQRF